MNRFLLYDQYAVDLAREETTLKDAFVFGVTTEQPLIALTFDDGPSRHTDSILSALKRLDAPATFFLTAARLTPENIAPYRSLLFRAELHGYTHDNFRSLNRERCFAEVARARAAFESLGVMPTYLRPPYGDITGDLKSALDTNNLTGVLWTLDSLDWNRLAGDRLVKRVVSNARNGDIVLLHETPWTAEALDGMVTSLRSRGFRIILLHDLLAFPKSPSP